jgi:hypothetical protein
LAASTVYVSALEAADNRVVDDLAVLAIQAATRFELTTSGRLVCERSPDRAPAPRMWLAGSTCGNVARFREDVDEESTRRLEELVAGEPPLSDPGRPPVHLADYTELLGGESSLGVSYVVPHALRYEHDFEIVEGAPLHAKRLSQEHVAMGFVNAGELWPPWCGVLEGGSIVSVAFAARLSPDGAEAGVATAPSVRGRGLAAAATAAWASLPSLRDRALFYSADAENTSSRRVADRLGLRTVGGSVSIR